MNIEKIRSIVSPIIAVCIVLMSFYFTVYATITFSKDYYSHKINDRCIEYHNTKTVKDAKNICGTIVYGEMK